MNPKFRLVVFDESRYWSEEILKDAGKIYRVYLYDANRPVHCCEITPSYELFPLYSTPLNYLEDDEARDFLEDEIREAEEDAVEYHHCSYIDSMDESYFYECGDWLLAGYECWDDIRSDVEEHYKCNIVFQFPKGVT